MSQTIRVRAFIFGMLHHLIALYQNTSSCGPVVEISPMLWGHRFLIEIKKEIFKNLLVLNCHVWHVASSIGPLSQNFKQWAWWGNWPYGLFLRFHIEMKKEVFKSLLVPNSKGKSSQIRHVASSRGPLPKYFGMCEICENWINLVERLT